MGASSYGACPLCGTGEAGGEHLVNWYPAVGVAWRRICGGRCSLRDAIHGVPGADPPDDVLAARLHQTSCMCGALLGRAGGTWG